MKIIKTSLLYSGLLVSSIILSSCQSNHIYNPKNELDSNSSIKNSRLTEAQKLDRLVSDFSEEILTLYPISGTYQSRREFNDKFRAPINEESLKATQNFDQKYLKLINAIDSEKLDTQSLLTYEIFKAQRELSIEGEEFPFHLIPVNQMFGTHNNFASLGSGESAQPFNNEEDYRNFIKRSEGVAAWMDSAIKAMREGVSQNVVLPQPILTKLIPQFKAHIVSKITNSVFYAPLKKLPKGLSKQASTKLIADYEHCIKDTIIPAYVRFHEFLTTEYSKSVRQSVGLSQLPNGQAWYAYMIKSRTTLPLTAKEIHNFGLSEVSRILSEMKTVKNQVKFDGDMQAFFEFLRTDDQFYFEEPAQLIKAYEDTKIKIDATLGKLFEVFPKADYVVKPFPAFSAASSAGASYESPSPDGSRPGVFYINTYNMRS